MLERGHHLLERLEIKMYTRVCYVVQVCQSLEAGRWLEEEKFENDRLLPSGTGIHPSESVCTL